MEVPEVLDKLRVLNVIPKSKNKDPPSVYLPPDAPSPGLPMDPTNTFLVKAHIMTGYRQDEATPYVHFNPLLYKPSYPKRILLSPEQVPWSVPLDKYNPPRHTTYSETENKPTWAHPADPNFVQGLSESKTYCSGGVLLMDAAGYPINPVGRTGIKGRGELGKWGPNFAADPIVIRRHPDPNSKHKHQFIAVQRNEIPRTWAIPGGMVEAGDTVSLTLKKEFEEETLKGKLSPEEAVVLKETLEKLFANGQKVFEGYSDDIRNTDQAWMETAVYIFRCPPDLSLVLDKFISPHGDGVETLKVAWRNIDPEDIQLFASHKDFLRDAVHVFENKSVYRPIRTNIPLGVMCVIDTLQRMKDLQTFPLIDLEKRKHAVEEAGPLQDASAHVWKHYLEDRKGFWQYADSIIKSGPEDTAHIIRAVKYFIEVLLEVCFKLVHYCRFPYEDILGPERRRAISDKIVYSARELNTLVKTQFNVHSIVEKNLSVFFSEVEKIVYKVLRYVYFVVQVQGVLMFQFEGFIKENFSGVFETDLELLKGLSAQVAFCLQGLVPLIQKPS